MELNSAKTRSYSNKTHTRAMLYFKEYCDYTGIHGFRYVAEDRTLREKIWWIISLVLSVIFCALMIYQILEKYRNYPVIVTFSMQEVHMNEIPFPAVTICPRAKISQKYFNITDAVIRKMNKQNFSGETERMYNLAATICDFYDTKDSNNDTKFDDFYSFLDSCETDIFFYCSYTGEEFDDETYFTRILTEEGNCYSFNIMDKGDIFADNLYNSTYYHKVSKRTDWNIEEGYVNPKNVNTYPVRAFRAGAKHGLFLVLKTKKEDIEYDCSSDENGYRILILNPYIFIMHNIMRQVLDEDDEIVLNVVNNNLNVVAYVVQNLAGPLEAIDPGRNQNYVEQTIPLYTPDEFRNHFQMSRGIFEVAVHLPSKIPDMSESYITVPFNQRVSGQIIPHLIKTSSGVKTFDPIQRDCYFQSERKLKFFKIYSQENCLIECKTEFMLQKCGCVGFYMPRYNDTPVCILEQIECMEKMEDHFTVLTMNLQLFDYKGKEPIVNCDCLPSCTDLTYSLEISQNNFVYKPHNIDYQLDEDYEYSILNLYFKRNHIETKERSELYGFSDFIANFGGLLGLFTGFSMLSFIEIIYFLSLRIWANIKMYGNWSGQHK